jgi:primosomal protein N' (replication factor Y)
VYHREENVLKCHYCGNRYTPPDLCPDCKGPHIKRGYVGTEQVAEKLKSLFPDAGVFRMDNDTTQGKDAHARILSEFSARKKSILVGTQMIAKGHDFSDVTLVGIIDADMSLHFSDFRSNERTFQLITQVAGRAGRENKKGTVILQTYSPHHYVYKYACRYDYNSFFEKECNLRETAKYPPFSKIVRVLIASENEDAAMSALKAFFEETDALVKQNAGSFAYFGAMRSPVKRIKDMYRMQILMRISDNFDFLIQRIYDIIDKSRDSRVTLFTEINPGNLS